MKHLPLRECGYAIVGVGLALALYVGAYLAMVRQVDFRRVPFKIPLSVGDECW